MPRLHVYLMDKPHAVVCPLPATEFKPSADVFRCEKTGLSREQ